MAFLIGILAGIGLPFQTSVNTRLKGRTGNPFYASLISFCVGLAFLILLLPLTGQDVAIPFDTMAGEPPWIYAGGICGVIFLTCNIILFPKIGGIRTAILPVLGQITMSIIIDSLGLFRCAVTPLTVWRVAGAVMVFAGVMVVSLAKAGNEKSPAGRSKFLLLLQILGVGAGMLSAVQTAVNGYLGRLIESPLKSTVVSFSVGVILLVVICVIIAVRKKVLHSESEGKRGGPWWMWTGGILGGLYVFANVNLYQTLGTGLTVVIVLTGTVAGGLIIDHFGLFGTPVKKITARKIAGVALMIAGAALIKLL